MSQHPTEFGAVQKPLITYAGQIGWDFVSRDDAVTLRKGETGILFYDLLKAKLQEFNSFLSPSDLDEIVKRIEQIKPNKEGNFSSLKFLRSEFTHYQPKEQRELGIKTIDFETPSNNVFQVSEEWKYTNGKFSNRADIENGYLDKYSIKERRLPRKKWTGSF